MQSTADPPPGARAYQGWDGRVTMLALAYFFWGWDWVARTVSPDAGLVVGLALTGVVLGSLVADVAAERTAE